MRRRVAFQEPEVLPSAQALAASVYNNDKERRGQASTIEALKKLGLALLALSVLMGVGWQLGQHHRRKNGGMSPTDRARAKAAAKTSILEQVQAEEAQLTVPRLFTSAELGQAKAAYEADPEHQPLLLVIVGHVFDVTAGEQFYAPGKGYGFFTFRDAARAYVTGTFTEDGLTDDLNGLTGTECQGVARWVNFFKDKEEYPFVGRLVGTYFDADGKPTYSYLSFRACAQKPGAGGDGGGEEACATSWEKDKGHTVWCEGGDGKVPRRRVPEGNVDARGRCVCVDLKDGTVHSAEAAGQLLVYPGCEAQASLCAFE